MRRTFNGGISIVVAVDPVVSMTQMVRLANECESAFVIVYLASA